MKPLLGVVVITLILSAAALDTEEKLTKEIESEATDPQTRKERCTTCTGGVTLNLKAPNEVLAAIQALPGAEVHTQQSYESCSSDKGCAGLKVKDGKVIEKFGNVDAFKAAAAADSGNEFQFHAGGAVFEGGVNGGPFWWMNQQNSPFKNAAGAGGFEKFSKSSSSFSSSGNAGQFGGAGGVDLAANPFLNGDFTKLGTNFGAGGADKNGFSSSSFESSSFQSSGKGDVDIAKNPFLNGGIKFGQGGQAGQGAFNSQSSFSQSNFGQGGKFGAGYTGSSPSPFTASTGGSNVNLIQNTQKASEFDYEQNQQNIDEAFQSTGNVHAHDHSGGDLQQTCAGQGYVCVQKSQCNNGVVNSNGAGILQAKTQKQYCNTRTEICCRIEVSTLSGAGSLQGSLGVGSATFQGSQGSGLFVGQGQSGSFGAEGSQSAFGQSGQFGANGANNNRGFGQGTQTAQGSSSFESSSSTFGSSGSSGNGFQAGSGNGFQAGQSNSNSGFGATFGAGSANRGTGGSSTFESSSFNKKFGSGTFGNGATVNPTRFGAGGNEVFKSTSQTNFVESDSFSSGSEAAGVFSRPFSGPGLKPGIPYLPPDNVNQPTIISSTAIPTTFTTPRPYTPRPTTARPYVPPVTSTAAPGYLPPQVFESSNQKETILPGPTKPPVYSDGGIILDASRTTAAPFVPQSEIPAGCAAALKCTLIEYCTAEGVISNTTVALTRDQEAYRVPLTDCKHLESGRIGKCCRDPLYTDPWPTNQLGQWVQGVFGGNDGKYVPDSKNSGSNRPTVTVRPPTTGSVYLNTNQPAKPTAVTSVNSFAQKGQFSTGGRGQFGVQGQGSFSQGGVTQVSQGAGQSQFSSSSQGSSFSQGGQRELIGQRDLTQGQGSQFGEGRVQLTAGTGLLTGLQGLEGRLLTGVQGLDRFGAGNGQFAGTGTRTQFSETETRNQFSGGQNQFGGNQGNQFTSVNGQGQFAGTQEQIAAGSAQGQFGAGSTQGQFSAGSTQGQFGAGSTQGQFAAGTGQLQFSGGGGQSFSANAGQSQFGSQGFSGQGAGVGGAVGFGQGAQAQGSQFASNSQSFKGQGQLVSQGQGAYSEQGQGAFAQGGRGQVGFGGQGQIGIGGAGAQGQFTKFQSESSSQTFGQGGQGVSQGGGALVNQGGGALVSQGGGALVNQGGGALVSQGGGALVSQGAGFGVNRGQGAIVSQGGGSLAQGGFGVGVSQGGAGFGIGFGTGVRQGVGSGLITGQGQGFTQTVGSAIRQGFGQQIIQGEGSEEIYRVFLGQFGGNGQCGIMNGQKPYGNRNDLEVDFAEIPWQAMVLLQTNRSLLCGGVITRPDVVITSAACVDGLEAKNVLIKGGEWKLGIDDEPLPFQIVQVKHILRHPFYKVGSLKNDVAILVLTENLRLAKNILPICLPESGETLDAFYNGAGECIVTGWGKQVLQAHLEGAIMHSLNVSLINPGECESKLSQDYPHLLEQYDQESCACGQPLNPVNNICRVDTGSALACTTDNVHYVLRGIYSWDSGCQAGNQLAAFFKFDLEWYLWAIGLGESTRFAAYSGRSKVTQNRFSGQINSVKGGNQFSGANAAAVSGVKGSSFSSSSSSTIKGGFGGASLASGNGQFGAANGQFASGKGQFGSGNGQFASGNGQLASGNGQLASGNGQFASGNGQFASGNGQFASGIKQFTSGNGQFGANGQLVATNGQLAGGNGQFGFSQFGQSSKFTEGGNFGAAIKGPISNSFSASYTEKKVFQTEPKIITYTTKPEIVTFTTKPEYFTYTTKPKLVTYTTKPQIITYETSGSGTNPQYVAPGVTFNPSFSEVVGHKHNAQCKCLDKSKK